MKKMTLERFLEIKEILSIVPKIIAEEIEPDEDLEEQVEAIFDELSHSDLSEIPAEAYEGFYDIGVEFEGTGANLDFNIINEEYRGNVPVRVKGCNIKNFKFDTIRYDEDSFDDSFIEEHNLQFWGRTDDLQVPKEVRKRYQNRNLTLEDMLKYDLFDKVDKKRTNYEVRELLEILPEEIISQIDLQLFNIFKYEFRTKLKGENKQITTLEEYDDVLKQIIIDEFEQTHLHEYSYNRLITFDKVRQHATEYIMNFPADDSSLKNAYFNNSLTPIHIYENKEIFRDKKFIQRMSERINFEQAQLTEEKIFYMFDYFPEFTEDILGSTNFFMKITSALDPAKTQLENEEVIREKVHEIALYDDISNENMQQLWRYYGSQEIIGKLTDYRKDDYATILKYTTPEKIDEYKIPPDILIEPDIIRVFRTFGLETVMDFDRENGYIFSKNNFKLLKSIYDEYIHYANNDHDPRTNITHREFPTEGEIDYTRPFTKEEFEQSVIKMIKKAHKDQTTGNRHIDYRNFSEEFKTRHPEMFLPENTSDELKEKFYNADISIADLQEHKDWIASISATDFTLGMEHISIYVKLPEERFAYSLIEYMSKEHKDKQKNFEFLINNIKYIDLLANTSNSYTHPMQLNENSNNYENSNNLEEIFKNYMLEYFFDSNHYTVEEKMMYIDELVKFDPKHIIQLPFYGITIVDNPTPEAINRNIKDQIVQKILDGTIRYDSTNYPDFTKEEYPQIFISENAPKKLQQKYYTTDILRDIYLGDLINPEYRDFLKGKDIPNTSKSRELKTLSKIFSIQDITRFADYDLEGLEIYAQNEEKTLKLQHALANIPDKFAKEELMNAFKISEEDFFDRLENDSELQVAYRTAKEEYEQDIVSMPGLFLYGTEEISRQDIRNYRNLDKDNDFRKSPDFRRDVYEQVLGHMYEFLGFDETKRILATPSIEAEELDEIYEVDTRIKDLYEKKFEVTGNIKTLSVLFSRMPSLLPDPEKITSKNTLQLFKTLNQKTKQGYEGDISTLLEELLKENGFPENSERIKSLVSEVISLHTDMKLDSLREYTSNKIDTEIQENLKTRKMIKQLYRNALEYSLNNSEKINLGLVREYLEKEFSRVNDEQLPYYSTHVTEHLEDLLRITEDLNNNPENSKIANKTIVDSVGEESKKIGNRWIMKIAQVANLPEKLTYDEAIKLDQDIYGQDSQHTVETKETVGLKKLSEEDKKRIFEILNTAGYSKVFTFNKAEIMFSAMQPPFSEEFRKYFLEHQTEFMENPEYYTAFTKINSKFDSTISRSEIQTRYSEGLLAVSDLVKEINHFIYEGVKEGEYELAYISRSGPLSEEQFKIAQKLYVDILKRESSTIPPVEHSNRRFRGRIVRIDDPLHLAIGEITNCCQTIGIGEPGESSMIHSATEKNGSLFVVEELDEKGNPTRIVAQSWTWRNGNRVTFDNVEIPHKTRDELLRQGGFDEIIGVYEEAAKIMFETDKKALDKLLKQGKITEEQYKETLLKDIAMGKGCDDLIKNLSAESRKKYPDFSHNITPLEYGKSYFGSEEKNLYIDSRSVILIAHNDEFDSTDHEIHQGDVSNLGLRYTKTRDIFRRKGRDIDQDKIKTIKDLVEKTDRKADSIFGGENIHYISDIANEILPYTYREDQMDYDNISISMSELGDWYILSQEKDNAIIIQDSGIDTTKPEQETEKSIINRKMVLAEYTREMLLILEEASEKEKSVFIEKNREGQFFPLQKLVESGEIALTTDGAIKVADKDKLRERIDSLNQILDASKKERMIADIGEETQGDSEVR